MQTWQNKKIHSSLRRYACLRHMAIYGPGLNRSGGQWEGNKYQVSMLHHVVIVKLDKCMPLWGEPSTYHGGGNGWCEADNMLMYQAYYLAEWAEGWLGHSICSHSDSHCRLISCEYNLYVSVVWSWMLLLPWLPGCLVALLPYRAS